MHVCFACDPHDQLTASLAGTLTLITYVADGVISAALATKHVRAVRCLLCCCMMPRHAVHLLELSWGWVCGWMRV
jgi:hypothetical protein